MAANPGLSACIAAEHRFSFSFLSLAARTWSFEAKMLFSRTLNLRQVMQMLMAVILVMYDNEGRSALE